MNEWLHAHQWILWGVVLLDISYTYTVHRNVVVLGNMLESIQRYIGNKSGET